MTATAYKALMTRLHLDLFAARALGRIAGRRISTSLEGLPRRPAAQGPG